MSTLEASIAALGDGPVLGRGSIAWRLARERAVVLMAPRAVMLQYAHPAFAAASHHYGTTAADPGARFERAVSTLLAMIFGGPELARKHARRVGRLHGVLGGTLAHGSPGLPVGSAWSATDPDALRWVLLTLVDALVRGSDLVHGRLSHVEVASLLAETRRFGLLFAVDPDALPTTRHALDLAIDDAARTTLAVGAETRAMWAFLGGGARGRLVQRWAAATLPPSLATALGVEVPRLEAAALRAGATGIARAWRRLPPDLRFVDAYRRAGSPRVSAAPRP